MSAQPPEALEWLAILLFFYIAPLNRDGQAPAEASSLGDECILGQPIIKVAEPFVLFLGAKRIQGPSGRAMT